MKKEFFAIKSELWKEYLEQKFFSAKCWRSKRRNYRKIYSGTGRKK